MKTVKRYLALDVLRGLTIVAMITVNNPGSWSHIYAPLKHSHWNGCTPTDLVFSIFLVYCWNFHVLFIFEVWKYLKPEIL